MIYKHNEQVQRQPKLYWGVKPLLASRTDDTDNMIDHALDAVKERDLVKEGDLLAITAGIAGSEPGTTNLMRIQFVEKMFQAEPIFSVLTKKELMRYI